MEIDLPFREVTGQISELEWVKVWHSSLVNPGITRVKSPVDLKPAIAAMFFRSCEEDMGDLVETWPSMFHPVTVISGKGTLCVSLDTAWRITNSVEAYWGEPENAPDLYHIYKIDVLPGEHRSSMVGDIFETSGERLFVILSTGYAEVPHPARVARIPRDQLPLYLHRNKIVTRMIERILKS